ncbi:MAG TPA: hypothetical protein VGK27_03720 [Candidatus Deferrimicrobiaceae bacterium]|jgi:hypothetical protein
MRAGSGAAALVFVLAVSLSSGSGAMSVRRSRPMKTVTGTVRVVGNEPFPRTVVTVFHDGVPADCLVQGPLESVLRDRHQGRVVVVEGTSCSTVPPGFADCIVPTKILPAD